MGNYLLTILVRSRDPFFILAPNHIFGIGEAKQFKCRVVIDTEDRALMHDRLIPKRICSASLDLFKCDILETVQNRHIVATCNERLPGNRKSYVFYLMAPILVMYSDLEGHFCCLKPFYLAYLAK